MKDYRTSSNESEDIKTRQQVVGCVVTSLLTIAEDLLQVRVKIYCHVPSIPRQETASKPQTHTKLIMISVGLVLVLVFVVLYMSKVATPRCGGYLLSN
jgi:hypothetical protein